MNKEKLQKFTSSKLFSLSLFLVVIIIFFEIASKGALLKFKNIRSIMQQCSVAVFLCIGAGLLQITGNSDLSLGGIGTLGPMVLAFAMSKGLPLVPALLAGYGAACLCGFINAAMVNWLHFPTFIATLGMASVSQGVAYLIGQGKNIDIDNDILAAIGSKRLFNAVPYSFIIALVALVIYSLMLTKTKLGRCCYFLGDNKEAARLTGLKPTKVSFFFFINAACMACTAGLLVAARLKNATVTGIAGRQFDGMTGSILGGISFGGGEGGLMGCLIGILILMFFDNGMQLTGVTSYAQTIAKGLLLFVALIYDSFMAKRRQKMALK